MATKTDPRALINTNADPALSNSYPSTLQTFPQLVGVNDVFVTQQNITEKITNVFQTGGGGGNVSTNTVNVFTKNQSSHVIDLTSVGGSVSMDASLSNNFRMHMTEDTTLTTPTNATDGMVINFQIRQGSAGNWVMTWPANFSWPAATPLVISTGANDVDFISMWYDGLPGTWRCVGNQNFGVPV
jgi:hypothetical protein